MKPSLTDTLCTRCGLCCDGSLFADVELAGRTEATRLAVMGLEVEDDDANGEVLLQPCAALRGRRCGIYAHRPKCCQTFECRLLQNVRRGAVSVERAAANVAEALRLVQRAKALLVQLGPRDLDLPLVERSAEALAREVRASREWNHERVELETSMSALGRLIRMVFLGGESTSRTKNRPGWNG